MPQCPPYSQHFSRALGSPAAFVVLGLDVALSPVLQRAGHVALHHVGTVAPRGKHSKTPSPPALADSSTPARRPVPSQVCVPCLTLLEKSPGGAQEPERPPGLCSCWGRDITHTSHWGRGQQWVLGECREWGRSKILPPPDCWTVKGVQLNPTPSTLLCLPRLCWDLCSAWPTMSL